jgi:tripartite-type tricarboxylate transporter receptor subunit TctC
MLVPAATPPAIVARLHDDVLATLARPEIRDRMKALGIEPPQPMTTIQFADFIRADAAYWETATKQLGMYRLE